MLISLEMKKEMEDALEETRRAGRGVQDDFAGPSASESPAAGASRRGRGPGSEELVYAILRIFKPRKPPKADLDAAIDESESAQIAWLPADTSYARGCSALLRALYRSLASKGVPMAQAHVASMRLEGRGASRDSAEAVDLFQKAAAGGSEDAQCKLGSFHVNGFLDVPADPVEAYKWLTLSGPPESCKTLYEEVRGMLTTSEMAEAERRAAVFKPAKSP